MALGVIGFVCLVQLVRFDFFERLEKITYDLRVRQALSRASVVATNLGFVAITDESIAHLNDGSLDFRFGLYWPRHIYGRVTRELAAQGAKAVAFDVLFGEMRPDHGPVVMTDESTIKSDDYFALQMKNAGNVILAAEQGIVPPSQFRTNALALGDISADKDSDGILRRARAFTTYHKWHRLFQLVEDKPEYGVDLRNARIGPKMIVLPRSQGDPIRIPLNEKGEFSVSDFVGPKTPPGMSPHEKPFVDERIWHMGIVLAAQELKLDLAHANVELNKGRITLTGTNGLQRVLPVDADGYFYINWCLTAKDARLDTGPISFTEPKTVKEPKTATEPIGVLLLQDRARQQGGSDGLADYWRNKLVLIGSSAIGNDLTDRGATPLEKNTILVSKHWNVANSILTGKFVRRSSLLMELFLICLMGAGAVFLTCQCRAQMASLLILATMAGYLVAAFLVYVLFLYWMPVVLPVMGGLLTTHACLLAYLVIFEQAEQRRVKSVFNRIVSPDVVTELLKTEKLSLTGARRSVTVLFADIRGFTEMTDVNRDKAADYIKEQHLTGEAAEAIFDEQARETLATVNLYLRVIAEMVLKNNGTIDKFIGDCVMAFWGAPIPNQKHALCCVQAAIAAQQAVHRLNQEREKENKQRDEQNLKLQASGQPLLPMLPVLAVGTGINTGVVTVGLMGSDQLSNYTVFGRDVNLASRLESVSGRGHIIISEATLAEIIQDDPSLALSCIELPPVTVKGIRTPVPIFEVPWRENQMSIKVDESHIPPDSAAQAAAAFKGAGQISR